MYADHAKLNRCMKLLETPVKVDRNKEPPRCRLCPYYQPDFRYRRCLFSACPYGKDRNTAFRRKPLRKEKIIGKEVGGMNRGPEDSTVPNHVGYGRNLQLPNLHDLYPAFQLAV